MELLKIRRKSSGNIRSVSSSSTTSSCSGDSSPVTETNSGNEVETHLIDMAEIAKKRRQGRSKSVPHVRRFRTSSVDETFEFVFNSKLDATSFQELPTTTLCSTELWLDYLGFLFSFKDRVKVLCINSTPLEHNLDDRSLSISNDFSVGHWSVYCHLT